MSTRLSDKQRRLLTQIAACEIPSDDFPNGLAFYVSARFEDENFNSLSECRRWLENLEARRLIKRTGAGGCFLRLTDAGRSLLPPNADLNLATTPKVHS